MSRTSLGLLLLRRRRELKLRQVQVARAVGISQSALSKIERGSLEPGLREAGRFYRLYARHFSWARGNIEIDLLELHAELERTPSPSEQSEIRAYLKTKRNKFKKLEGV